jgi:hypothetical protein
MKQLLKIQIRCIAFVLVAVFTSCSKDKQTLMESTWIVESAKKHADSAWMDNWDYPTISFIGKDKYVFQSDFYTYIGNVKIEKSNKISFERKTVSSPIFPSFSYSCFFLLHEINHYEIKSNKLILTGYNGETIMCYY